MTRRVAIELSGEQAVSGLLNRPASAFACYVLAHGAGAGMSHPFLEALSHLLAERDLATLRFQFPSMERGSKRPDPPAMAQAAARAAVASAARLVPDLPLFAGGKSFGGRMTSQAQASSELPNVRGLVFVGYPLHLAMQPSTKRAEHLIGVRLPMLFVQGTRDDLAHLPELRAVCDGLQDRATLKLIDDADHSFHVRARSGRSDHDAMNEIADTVATWIGTLAQ